MFSLGKTGHILCHTHRQAQTDIWKKVFCFVFLKRPPQKEKKMCKHLPPPPPNTQTFQASFTHPPHTHKSHERSHTWQINHKSWPYILNSHAATPSKNSHQHQKYASLRGTNNMVASYLLQCHLHCTDLVLSYYTDLECCLYYPDPECCPYYTDLVLSLLHWPSVVLTTLT